MGPIKNCDFEMIAVLPLHGADPLAPMKTFISGRSGDKEIETTTLCQPKSSSLRQSQPALTNPIQLLKMDILVLATIKNAAKCDT